MEMYVEVVAARQVMRMEVSKTVVEAVGQAREVCLTWVVLLAGLLAA